MVTKYLRDKMKVDIDASPIKIITPEILVVFKLSGLTDFSE